VEDPVEILELIHSYLEFWISAQIYKSHTTLFIFVMILLY